MASNLPSPPEPSDLEGDYRPANPSGPLDPTNARVEPADAAYLMQLARSQYHPRS